MTVFVSPKNMTALYLFLSKCSYVFLIIEETIVESLVVSISNSKSGFGTFN